MGRKVCISILLFTYFLYYSTRNLLTSASAYFIYEGYVSKDAFAIAQTVAYLLILPAKLFSGFIARALKTDNSRLGFFTLLPSANVLLLLTLATVSLFSTNAKVLQITFVGVYCFCKLLTSFARVILIQIFQKSFTRAINPRSEIAAFSTTVQVISALGDAAGKLSFGSLLKTYHSWEKPLIIIAATSSIGVFANATLFRWRSKEIKFNFLEKRKKEEPFTLKGLCTSRFVLCSIVCMLDSLIGVALGAYSTHLIKFGFGVDAAEATRLDAVPPLILLVGVAIGGYCMRRFERSKYRFAGVLLLPYALFNIGFTCALYGNMQVKGSATLSLVLLFAQNAAFYWTRNQIDGSYLMLITPSDHAAIATGIISGLGYVTSLIVPYLIKNYSLSYEGWLAILQCVIGVEALTLVPLTVLTIIDSRLVQQERIFVSERALLAQEAQRSKVFDTEF